MVDCQVDRQTGICFKMNTKYMNIFKIMFDANELKIVCKILQLYGCLTSYVKNKSEAKWPTHMCSKTSYRKTSKSVGS